MNSIATVIVTWNQIELTLDCLAALAAAEVPSADIWVVDNGSHPDVLPHIRERFPDVRMLRLEENVGFTGGCNAGIQAAFADGADGVFLLNNDALVERETFSVLATALAQDADIAAVSPKVYYYDTPHIIQSTGLSVDPDSGQARMLGSNEPDCGQYDRPMERDALFGCALLIRRQAWEQVGQFWEPFFNYAEETDWCLRARRLGWRLLYIPQAVVWHRTSSSLGSGSPLKAYLIARNQLYLRRRHQRGGWRGYRGFVYAIYMHVRTAARYLRMLQPAQARAIVLAEWDFLLGRTGNTRSSDLRLRKTKRTMTS